MALMIPDVPAATTESSAEVELFRLLQAQLPDEFHVYHSVAFVLSGGQHHAPREGEIDFLVVHRELGLLAIEVKGGRIAFDGQRRVWTSTGRTGTHEINDPFRQAELGIRNLIREIEERKILGVEAPRFGWGHCVAFPHLDYDARGFPAHCPADLVIDAGKPSHLKDWITAIMAHRVSHPGKRAMTRQEMKLLAQRLLAPRFQLALSLQAEFGWEERALRLLTAEQAVCLDFLSLNPTALVQGPAGTGKTLVALEHARRQAEQGARVLFLCFNLPLAHSLRQTVATYKGLAGSIWAGAYHQLCAEWAAKVGLPFTVPRSPSPRRSRVSGTTPPR